MARKAGLGRGLDALFADAAPIYEEEYNADTLRELNRSVSEADADEAVQRSEANASKDAQQGSDAQPPETSGKGAKAGSRKASDAGAKSVSDAGAKSASGTGAKKASGSGAGSAAKKKVSASQGSSPQPVDAKASKEAQDADEDRVIYIDINDIKPNSAQPRMNFDEEKLKELAESIRINGVIQPLIVRKGTNGYELVAGERRWRASRIAELKKVPCIIRDFDDRQNAIVAIIENMQREDLNPIEEALGLRSMTEKYGFTQEQVSASLGRSRTYIANSIRLLKLPPEIQEYVSSGQMSAAHGRTIINIPDKVRQKEVADKIIRNDLSVRATEKLAERVKDELRPARKRRKKPSQTSAEAKSDEVRAVEQELMTLTGTKVNITGETSGRLELEFYSTEELNRLIDIIRDAFR